MQNARAMLSIAGSRRPSLTSNSISIAKLNISSPRSTKCQSCQSVNTSTAVCHVHRCNLLSELFPLVAIRFLEICNLSALPRLIINLRVYTYQGNRQFRTCPPQLESISPLLLDPSVAALCAYMLLVCRQVSIVIQQRGQRNGADLPARGEPLAGGPKNHEYASQPKKDLPVHHHFSDHSSPPKLSRYAT